MCIRDRNIFLLTRYPKSLVSLDKADHLLTKQGTAARAADLIGAWAEQFIVPDYTPEEVGTDAAVAQPATGTKFGVVVRHNDHSLSADRTKKNGGKGKGFTAEGLLMSALAAASTQAIKEAGKKLALDDVHVSIIQPALPASSAVSNSPVTSQRKRYQFCTLPRRILMSSAC